MRIEDNGCGFNPQQAVRKDNHFGLQFMCERAEQLGGAMRVRSAPGAGTCVELDVPVEVYANEVEKTDYPA